MNAHFAPEIARLVDCLAEVIDGQPAGEACHEALADACECHLRTAHRARLVASLVPAAELGRELEERLQQREEVLGKLERELSHRAVLVGLTLALQDASYRIAQLGAQLEAARRALPADAADPGLDEAIKVARAVVEGRAPSSFLVARLPELMALHDRLEAQERQLRPFYPQLKWPALPLLREGLGALAEGELAPALELLTQAGRALEGQQADLRGWRRRDGFSEVGPLDTLAWLHRKGTPAQVEEQLKVVRDWHARLGPPAWPNAGWDRLVRPAWQKFAQGSGHELIRLGEELVRQQRAWLAAPPPPRSLARDEAWQDLREAVMGWHQGSVPLPLLRLRRDAVRAALLEAELRLGEVPAAEREGLRTAVRTPLALLDELEGLPREGLPGWVTRLEAGFDRWLWARDRVARVSSPAPGPATLLARLRLARGTPELRPLLVASHTQARLALTELARWRGTEEAEQMERACRELDETLTELLEADDSPTLAEHGEVLDHVLAQVERLSEVQARLRSQA